MQQRRQWRHFGTDALALQNPSLFLALEFPDEFRGQIDVLVPMLERGFDVAELRQLIEGGDVQPVGIGAHGGFEGAPVVGALRDRPGSSRRIWSGPSIPRL